MSGVACRQTDKITQSGSLRVRFLSVNSPCPAPPILSLWRHSRLFRNAFAQAADSAGQGSLRGEKRGHALVAQKDEQRPGGFSPTCSRASLGNTASFARANASWSRHRS